MPAVDCVCQCVNLIILAHYLLIYIYMYTLYIYPGHYPCQGQSSVCMCVCARVLLAWKTNRNQLKSRVRSRISTCTCQRPLGAINCEELFRLPAAASGFGRGRPWGWGCGWGSCPIECPWNRIQIQQLLLCSPCTAGKPNYLKCGNKLMHWFEYSDILQTKLYIKRFLLGR